jgi:Protein of unknown function (DUF2716)
VDATSRGPWEQVGDVRKLPFEVLDSFLGLPADPPAPWVLVDLAGIWVPHVGVPFDVYDEIERAAVRAFRTCTEPDEWIWAWDAPDEYSDDLYRFWPHRADQLDAGWSVGLYPNGDDKVFVSQTFEWGVYAMFQYTGPESWGLRVFGKRLLDALAKDWPAGWSEIVRTSGHSSIR